MPFLNARLSKQKGYRKLETLTRCAGVSQVKMRGGLGCLSLELFSVTLRIEKTKPKVAGATVSENCHILIAAIPAGKQIQQSVYRDQRIDTSILVGYSRSKVVTSSTSLYKKYI